METGTAVKILSNQNESTVDFKYEEAFSKAKHTENMQKGCLNDKTEK